VLEIDSIVTTITLHGDDQKVPMPEVIVQYVQREQCKRWYAVMPSAHLSFVIWFEGDRYHEAEG